MKTAQEIENLFIQAALEMYADVLKDCTFGDAVEEKAFLDKFGIPVDVGYMFLKGMISDSRDLNNGAEPDNGRLFDGLSNYIADRVLEYIEKERAHPAAAQVEHPQAPVPPKTNPLSTRTLEDRLPAVDGALDIFAALPDPWDEDTPGGPSQRDLVEIVLKASPEPLRLMDVDRFIRLKYPDTEFGMTFAGNVLSQESQRSDSPIEKVAPGLYRYAHEAPRSAIPYQDRNLPGKKPEPHVPALDDQDIGDRATWPTMITQVLRDSGEPMTPAQIIAGISLKFPGRHPISQVISTEISKLSKRFDSPVIKVKHGVYKFLDHPKPETPSDLAFEDPDDEEDEDEQPTDEQILDSGETIIDYIKNVHAGRPPTLVKCNQCPEYLKPRDIGDHKKTAHPIKVRA